MMFVPPVEFPFGGKITHINTTKFEEQSRLWKRHRSRSRHNNQYTGTVRINP